MDLKLSQKPLSKKWGPFSSKQAAFLGVAGLILVAGVFLRAGHYFGQPAEEEKAPVAVEAPPPAAAAPPAVDAAESVPKTPPATQETAATPNEPAKQPADAQQAKPEGDAVEQAEQPEPADPAKILVSRRPVEVLASPSASASAMYGFPAGRPFRVIGREAGFAHIQDVRSGASGWIDEAALAPPPPPPAAAAPSRSRSGAGGRKPATASAKATKKSDEVDSDVADRVDTVPPRRRPGLFGKGGLFGGIFGGGN